MNSTITYNDTSQIRISSFPFKNTYTTKEKEQIIKKYSYYLIRSMEKGWGKVHDAYCIALNYVLDNSPKNEIGKHLYIMSNGEGLYKIGRSNAPKVRAKDLEIETGFNIQVLQVFANQGKEEINWHRRFKEKRERFTDGFGRLTREWFKLSGQDVSTIIYNYGSKKGR